MLDTNFIDISLGNAKEDDSQVVEQSLIATTANIIGTAYKGPAFVPQKIFAGQTIGDAQVYNTLENTLGTARQNQYAHLFDNYTCHADSMAYDAASLWLNNGGIYSSFTRVLGIGTGTIDSNTGKMSGSGFNAANDISSGTLTHQRGPNLNAVANGKPGNVTFLLKTFEEKDLLTFDYIDELGIDTSGNKKPHFITDVVLFASGVLPSLTTGSVGNITYSTGSSDYDTQVKSIASISSNNNNILMLGHNPYIENSGSSNFLKTKVSPYIKDSFGNSSNQILKQTNYLDNNINYFADKFLNRGHLNYASFSFAGMSKEVKASHDCKILTTKPFSEISNNTNLPDFNSFESEFTTAKTPWITAQPFNREGIANNRTNIHEKVQNLFRFWSLDDGEIGNRFRIKINPKLRGDTSVTRNASPDEYATFDIYVFEYDPRINSFEQLEYYENVNLDPESKDYIGRQIGTVYSYYDFTSKKVIEKGLYENKSKVLRVEIDNVIEYKVIQNQHEYIPSGFRSYPHISLKKECFSGWYDESETLFDINGVYHLPPMFALNYYTDTVLGEESNVNNNWGVIFTQPVINSNKQTRYVDSNDGNETNLISPHFYYTKYFLNGLSNIQKDVWVEQDNYLNSFFHLEKIRIKTDDAGNFTLTYNESNAMQTFYKHSGATLANNYEYLNLNDNKVWKVNNREIIAKLKNKLSFDFFTYGGFDGVDIRDSDKRFLRNDAVIRELNDANETKSTYTSYDKAIDIAMDEANCAGDIFLMPGIKEIPLIDKVLKKCEEDRRHFFIADIGGASSNRVVSFDKIEIDNSGVVSAGDAVKKSRGIMGNFFFVSNILSSYDLNKKELEDIDQRFSLGTNSITGQEFYKYSDVLKKQHDYAVSTWKGLDLRSRYIMPTFGDLIASNADTDFQKQVTSDSFVLGKLAQVISPRQSLSLIDAYPQMSSDLGEIKYNLINEEDLLENNLNFDILAKDLRNAAVNILYKPRDGNIKLLSESTSYENRKSIFQLQSIVRTLQEIKKRLRIDIFTNDSLVNGGILFSQNASFQNIYARLKIQIDNLMQSFLDAGYIQDYRVMIPESTDPKTVLDMQNYIIRGHIVLQFGDSDIINLSIDEVLSNLSLLSDTNQDSVLVLNV